MNQTTSYVTWGQTTRTAAWYPYVIATLTGFRNCPFISGRAAPTLLIYPPPPLFLSLVITLYPPTYKGAGAEILSTKYVSEQKDVAFDWQEECP